LTDIAAARKGIIFMLSLFSSVPSGEWNMKLEKFFIDEKKPVHVTWWAQQFDVPEEVLLEAIAAVGNRAKAVRIYLDEREQRSAAQSAPLTIT